MIRLDKFLTDSGAGTRSQVKVMLKAGRVTVDGLDVRDVTLESLRRAIGIVQQDVFLFADTIRENIRYGRPDATDEEVVRAAELAQIDGFVRRTPKGYATEVGERGLKLSGGEKQRISIARSLLKKSQVLLVDEATAALDAETAYQVLSAILGLKDVTSIVVTHSLDEGLLKQYDGIITLKNGSIVETGTFDELIAEKGYFYSLFTISQ